MSKASDEISHYPEYDYILVNEDAAATLAQLQAVLTAERLKRDRQTGLSDFVQTLRSSL
jgi:guanylate kinase